MPELTQEQIDRFWNDGVLVVEDAATIEQLDSLRAVFARWVAESRTHVDDYGETLDGRPRFDLQLQEAPKATSFFAQHEWADIG